MIDVCRDCRGVFLDRGELDKLLDTATVVAESSPLTDEAERFRRGRGYEADRDYDGGGRGRRRRDWLDDIFDFD